MTTEQLNACTNNNMLSNNICMTRQKISYATYVYIRYYALYGVSNITDDR